MQSFEHDNGAAEEDLESDRFLDIIACSDDLRLGLLDAPSDAHREAIVDIHAYLDLLQTLTHLGPEELKSRLGCKRSVDELPECPLHELQRSRDFLALASELTLLTEKPSDSGRQTSDVAGQALELAVQTFRRAQGDLELARVNLPRDVLEALADGEVSTASMRVEAHFGVRKLERFTASGQRVLLDVDIARGLANAALGSGAWGISTDE